MNAAGAYLPGFCRSSTFVSSKSPGWSAMMNVSASEAIRYVGCAATNAAQLEYVVRRS